MSRILSWVLVCLDILWVLACCAKLPAKEAYVPVSAFLAACTGSALAAYGANSYAGAQGRFSMGINYDTPGPPVSKAKPAPPEGEK